MRKFKVFINHISVNIYAFLLQNCHSYPRLSEGVWNILDMPSHAFLESFWILKHIWPHEFWVRDLRRIIDIYWLFKRKSIRMVWESFSKHHCALGAWDTCFPPPFLWFSCVYMYLCVCVYTHTCAQGNCFSDSLVLRLCQHLNIDLRTFQSRFCVS